MFDIQLVMIVVIALAALSLAAFAIVREVRGRE